MKCKSLKKIIAVFIIITTLILTCTLSANAAEYVRETYLRFSKNFLSDYDDLWEYPHLGFRYRDSSCAVVNATFDFYVRRYNSPTSIIYRTVLTCENLPSLVDENTWVGNMWNYIIDGYPPYAYRNYFKIHNNDGNQIYAKHFQLINRDYIAAS